MNAVRFPDGYRLEPLRKSHPRAVFRCGQAQVDDWLATKALQNQDKRLSATKALIAAAGDIAGFYTLATAQVDFSDLPPELCRHLPRRDLPVWDFRELPGYRQRLYLSWKQLDAMMQSANRSTDCQPPEQANPPRLTLGASA